jgi:hypothetical protein
MREKISATGATPDAAAMEPLLSRHVAAMLAALRATPNIELLTVDYPSLIAAPAVAAYRVAEFLGPELLPAPDAMAEAVRPELYHEKEAVS